MPSLLCAELTQHPMTEQTMNTAPDDFHHEFWYFAYFSMKLYVVDIQ